MSRDRKKSEEPDEGLPAWIVSFTDMITLLLAFFVLLQAFAQEQHPELFQLGRGSFESVIHNFGLPVWRTGRDHRVRRDWFVRHYSDEPSDEEHLPIVDAEEERLQRIFQELRERFDSASGEMEMISLRVEATPVKFSGRSTKLNREARQYLSQLAVDLANNLPAGSSSIYLVGLAPNQQGSQKQWVYSAQRAQAAEDYLRERLEGQGRNWSLYSWGGGRTFGRFPEGTYLGLVVMGEHHGRGNG